MPVDVRLHLLKCAVSPGSLHAVMPSDTIFA
jgi:hypothetical protein